MADLLGPEGLIAEPQNVLQRRHPRPHPVRQLLLSGRLTKEQLQGWARNQFHQFRNIHRSFGVRYQKCPVPDLRRMLLENMVEEEGEDLFGGKYPSHRELWVQFANGLGIARDDMLNSSLCRAFALRWKCTFRWSSKVIGQWRSAQVWYSKAADRSG